MPDHTTHLALTLDRISMIELHDALVARREAIGDEIRWVDQTDTNGELEADLKATTRDHLMARYEATAELLTCVQEHRLARAQGEL